MKKIISFLLMLTFVFSSVSVYAAEHDGISAVLIIDTSGSMAGTDKNRIAIEATKLFIDMMEDNGSQVAVLAFNSNIAMEIPLTKINSQADKDKIKSSIDGLKYDGETDMGIALKRGCEILSTSGMERNNVIVFFTDGKIDFYASNTTRTIAQSEREVDEAINSIRGKFPIYTIGLNANGGVDENIIGKMANETGGEKYIVTDSSELTKIYNTIFAKFIKSNLIDIDFSEIGEDNKTVASIKIPNNSVFEANIVAFADKPLTDISAVSPTGQQGKAVKTISSKYAMLKLINPETGNWQITVSGTKGCKVDATILFNYDIQLEAKIDESTQYNKGDNVHVDATLSTEDGVIEDAAFYENIYVECMLTKPDNTTESFEMTYVGGKFGGDINLPEKGDYSIVVRANGDNFYRITEPINISTVEIDVKSETTTKAHPQTTDAAAPSSAENESGLDISVIIGIAAVVVLIVLLLFALKKHKEYKFKTRTLKGQLIIIDEERNEAEYSLAGKKGGSNLYDIAEETETNFDLKKIKLYFSFDKETCIEFVNKSSYEMKKQGSLKGKETIVLKSGESLDLTDGTGEDTRVLTVKYEYY